MRLNKNKNLYKHLILEERIIIEDRLNCGRSIRSIAAELGKSPSTILREIQKYVSIEKSTKNDCLNYKDCNYHGLCGKPDCKKRLCSKCHIPCKKFCPDYVKAYCEKQTKSPHVCNACTHRDLCRYEKQIYRGSLAESYYKETLTNARSGFDITDDEIKLINSLTSPLLKNGLSPYHVKQTYGEQLPISESTWSYVKI